MASSARVLSLIAVTCLVAGGLVLVPQPEAASASLACQAHAIKIDGGVNTVGHSHVTGSHYVYVISGNVWTWYADNYEGLNGNSPNTYYGKIAC